MIRFFATPSTIREHKISPLTLHSFRCGAVAYGFTVISPLKKGRGFPPGNAEFCHFFIRFSGNNRKNNSGLRFILSKKHPFRPLYTQLIRHVDCNMNNKSVQGGRDTDESARSHTNPDAESHLLSFTTAATLAACPRILPAI